MWWYAFLTHQVTESVSLHEHLHVCIAVAKTLFQLLSLLLRSKLFSSAFIPNQILSYLAPLGIIWLSPGTGILDSSMSLCHSSEVMHLISMICACLQGMLHVIMNCYSIVTCDGYLFLEYLVLLQTRVLVILVKLMSGLSPKSCVCLKFFVKCLYNQWSHFFNPPSDLCFCLNWPFWGIKTLFHNVHVRMQSDP